MQQQNSGRKLAKETEAHSDRAHFLREDLGHPKIPRRTLLHERHEFGSSKAYIVVSLNVPCNIRYKKTNRIATAFPALFEVPAYCAVRAASIESVTTQPTRPMRNIFFLELTRSCSQAPPGLYIKPA